MGRRKQRDDKIIHVVFGPGGGRMQRRQERSAQAASPPLNDGSRAQLVANPVQFDEQPFAISGAPECGQNTEEVLLELGLSWDDLVRLKSEKAIV